ncbi:unnamed protein product, partial [marine sediment metagenome]
DILKQMARIARKYIIIFDYCCDSGWLIRFIEWLEGPNYPQFIGESREKEFNEAGLKINKYLRVSAFGGAWLCTPANPVTLSENE